MNQRRWCPKQRSWPQDSLTWCSPYCDQPEKIVAKACWILMRSAWAKRPRRLTISESSRVTSHSLNVAATFGRMLETMLMTGTPWPRLRCGNENLCRAYRTEVTQIVGVDPLTTSLGGSSRVQGIVDDTDGQPTCYDCGQGGLVVGSIKFNDLKSSQKALFDQGESFLWRDSACKG